MVKGERMPARQNRRGVAFRVLALTQVYAWDRLQLLRSDIRDALVFMQEPAESSNFLNSYNHAAMPDINLFYNNNEDSVSVLVR
jgi:hypothetical protein